MLNGGQTPEQSERPSSKPDGNDLFHLTSASLVELDYIAPPAELRSYITTLFHFRCDEAVIRDIQPAAIGQLTLFPRGKGEMQFRNGQCDPNHEVSLVTPNSVSVPFFVDGPMHAIGASLSPLGWAALTGMHAGEHGNRLYRASDWLGKEVETMGEAACEDYREGRMSAQECADALCEFIASKIKPVNQRHAELINQTQRWLGSDLDPRLDALYEKLSYSQRQSQRLIERYFGLNPRALRRKYRALRAASFLFLPTLTPEYEARLGEAFYDQSHMIKEIRLFAGRTPTRLNDEESPYLMEMLDLRNFREIDSLGPETSSSA